MLGSADIAIKKAKTARHFGMPTGELGSSLFSIEVLNGGAIGVPGDSVGNDHTVAEAGMRPIQ